MAAIGRIPEIGIARGHHDLSHHQGSKENLEMIAQIDKFHMKYFGQFLEKLAAAEGRRRRLRSCTIR